MTLWAQQLHLPWWEAKTDMLKSNGRGRKILMTGCYQATWGACIKLLSEAITMYICVLFSVVALGWDFIATLNLCSLSKGVDSVKYKFLPFSENTNIQQLGHLFLPSVSLVADRRVLHLIIMQHFYLYCALKLYILNAEHEMLARHRFPFLPNKFVCIADWGAGKSGNALLI